MCAMQRSLSRNVPLIMTSNVYTWPILYKEINVFKLMQMYHKYIHER